MLSLTSPIRTRYHQLPVGWKYLALALFTVYLFSQGGLWVAIAATAFVGFLYLIEGIEFFRLGLSRLKPLRFFLIILFIYHAVTNTPLEGVLVSLRLIAAIGFANLVTMTSKLDESIDMLSRLTRPLERIWLNSSAFSISIALVIRSIPHLLERAAVLASSWRARSANRLSWRVIVPLALSVLDDSEQIADALKARGGIQSKQKF